MDQQQTFTLEDDSIVNTDPYPVLDCLKKLNERELFKLYFMCDRQIQFDISVNIPLVLLFSEEYKDLIKKLLDFNLIKKIETNYSISSDIRKIVFNSIMIAENCCRKYIEIIDPMKKYNLEYTQDECVIL